ncbi:MAG: hypothetical protein KTR33_11165 [Gammaproteobacteria bacterium]|nr:hypothetical protein [Gammaproteobacteria bacterium]
MKSALSVTHLIRHFLLFVFTVLFLLTVVRAGLNLWLLHKVGDVPTLTNSFLTGLRFDLATIGYLLLVPIVVVTLLGIFKGTRAIARWFSLWWMMLALLLVMLLELVTPYFIHTASVRPDIHVFNAMEDPVATVASLWSIYLVPALIGIVLVTLIAVAFWSRMDSNRFLRYPVVKWSGFLFLIVGVALCLLAIRSSIELKQPALGPDAALISVEGVVNEIALNSTYKLLHSVLGEKFSIDGLQAMVLPGTLKPAADESQNTQ